MANSYLIVFLLFTLTLGGCNKEKQTLEPNLPPTASFTRSLNFPDIMLRRDTSYTTQAVSTQTLRVSTFNSVPAIGFFLKAHRDSIAFIIPVSSVTSDWIGTYTFLSGQCVSCTTQALHIYKSDYLINQRRVFAQFGGMDGALTIDKYNPTYKTVSGHFIYSYSSYISLYSTPTSGPTRFDLSVRGTFNNIPTTP